MRKPYDTPEFRQLQRDFDDRLRADGFNDIERNRRRPAPFDRDVDPFTTLDDRHVSIDSLAYDFSVDGETLTPLEYWEARSLADHGGVETTVAQTDTATYWYDLHHQANALPTNYRHRAFVIAWTVTGDVLDSARQHGLSHKTARIAVDKFLARVAARRSRQCLPIPPADPDPPPGPVRHLTPTEIAKLNYHPPQRKRE